MEIRKNSSGIVRTRGVKRMCGAGYRDVLCFIKKKAKMWLYFSECAQGAGAADNSGEIYRKAVIINSDETGNLIVR